MRLRVLDILGRRVWALDLQQVKAAVQPLALSGMVSGIHALKIIPADGTNLNLRLMIEKPNDDTI